VSYPAQLVFIESDRGHSWTGKLLTIRGVIDRETGKPIKKQPIFLIEENPKTGRCMVMMQGASSGGRRYAHHPSVSEAQRAGVRWAARRFRVEAMK
jgi:hypothetical protein